MSRTPPHVFSARLIRGAYVLPLLGSLILAGWGCSGCAERKTPQPTTAPFQGEKIGVAVPAGLGFETAWDINLHEWAARTGAEFEFREVDFQDSRASLLERLAPNADKTAGGGGLVVFPLSRMAELTSADALAKLPELDAADDPLDWRDVFQGLRERIASNEAGPAVIPLSAPVLVCYYREDLLRQAGLSLPQTWDDYQRLLEKLETWAPDLVAVEPWGEATRSTMFLARAVSYAHHPGHYSLFFDIETGAPLIGGPGFVRALEASQAALAKMPPEVLNYNVQDCRREILAGKAAIGIAYEADPDHPGAPFESRQPRSQPLAGAADAARPQPLTLGFCRLPGATEVYNATLQAWEAAPTASGNQVTLTGFSGLAAGVLARGSPTQAQAAWNLLAALTMDDSTASFPPGTRGLCRESQLLVPEAWVGRELSPAATGRYVDVVAKSLRDRRQVAELPILRRAEFRQALTQSLGRVLNRETDPQAGLAEAAQAWSTIMEQIGSEQVRDSYRRSLGLPPLGDPASVAPRPSPE